MMNTITKVSLEIHSVDEQGNKKKYGLNIADQEGLKALLDIYGAKTLGSFLRDVCIHVGNEINEDESKCSEPDMSDAFGK